ncbi:MAG TPA: TetR/AcrR family transcriptional regulator [Jatrophihabitans sp.]|jgi:AcrR family transcriptional regulator|nr:TetR/AcrR family transcriptional regulator [Jatrophihabitans sp.]
MTALPNRDRRAERREATRREILDAAWLIARRDGLTAVTLREVGEIVGMRAPSLYSHFASKNAIYDAMFAESWQGLIDVFLAATFPGAPRQALFVEAEVFFDYATADLARDQLMNRRIIHDFEPSEAAFAIAIEAYERLRDSMRSKGVKRQADLDLWTALLAGAINQQHANDLGGKRWRRQLPRLVDMFCDEVDIPGPPLRRAK